MEWRRCTLELVMDDLHYRRVEGHADRNKVHRYPSLSMFCQDPDRLGAPLRMTGSVN